MSLARTLLNTSASDEIDTSMYQFTCEASDIEDSMYLDSACESLITDIYNVDKAFHVADIMGEVKVIKEGADASVLLEGMIGSAKEKLVAAFKKFIAKIKAWFEAVVRYFKSFFLQGKKFVNEFKDAIRSKYNTSKGKGFSYHGYKYTLSAGDALVDKILANVSKVVDTGASKINDKMKSEDISKSVIDEYTEKNKKFSDDTSEVSGKKVSTSELSDLIKKTYRDGDTEKGDIEDFASVGVDVMLDMVGGKAADVQSKAKKAMDELTSTTNTIIKQIEKLGDPAKNENDNVYKLAHAISAYATSVLNVGTTASNAKIDAYKEACNTYRGVLGAFYRWKPAKEGADIDIDTGDDADAGKGDDSTEECKEATSIFEAAYSMF